MRLRQKSKVPNIRNQNESKTRLGEVVVWEASLRVVFGVHGEVELAFAGVLVETLGREIHSLGVRRLQKRTYRKKPKQKTTLGQFDH